MIRKLVCMAVLLGVASLSAQTSRPIPSSAPPVLPVTKVVLYKSGIGYFEHQATVTGNQSLAIQFTADQLDDVLKSLSALDLGNGRIVGVSYDSPTPLDRQLRGLSLPLAAQASTLDVLAAARGAGVEVRRDAGVVSGRVLNVDRRSVHVNGREELRVELSLVTASGELMTIPLTATTRVRLTDAATRQEIGRYLNVSTTTGQNVPRRLVISAAGTGARPIVVSYVGEAAVWKSTYRLIFPSGGGEPVLQGWGVVDNMSASDWNNVELSMMAGAPQAYRQPLSTPIFASRPLIPVPLTTGLTPMTFDGALVISRSEMRGRVSDTAGSVLPGVTVELVGTEPWDVSSVISQADGGFLFAGVRLGVYRLRATMPGFNSVEIAGIDLTAGGAKRDVVMRVGSLSEAITVTGRAPVVDTASARMAALPRGAWQPPPAPAFSREVLEQAAISAPIAAVGADLGDLFEYKVKERVSIGRNQSALVPILQARVPAERVSIWNHSMGTRPRRAVWLTNKTDLTLDAGSVSIIDGGAFSGEGPVDVTKPGERRFISYAGDTSVVVSETEAKQTATTTIVRIAQGWLTKEVEERRTTTYTIRNNDRQARTMLLEHPRADGWSLADGVHAAESTASVYRFRVPAPSADTTTFAVEEYRRVVNRAGVADFTPDSLIAAVESGEQRAEVEAVLAPVFAKSQEMQAVAAQIEEREAMIERIHEDQERLRENIGALKGSKEERQLLKRYTGQLDAQETKLDMVNVELESLHKRDQQLSIEFAQLVMAASLH